MISLRDGLTKLLLAVLLPIWLLVALATYWSAVDEVDEMDERQILEVAQPYLTMSVVELQRALDKPPQEDEDHDEMAISVLRWGPQGDLLYRSPVAPSLSFSEHPAEPAEGTHAIQREGEHWRVLWDGRAPEGGWTAVVRTMSERDEMARALAFGLVMPALVSALVLLPLVWWAVRRGLRPLSEVGRQVAQRRSQDLSPINVDEVPREVMPLLDEINALLGRLDRAMAQEKQFTADASHELRTPLAAATAQIEVAQGATDEAQRAVALRQARAGLARASNLTDQLLSLARLDHHLDGKVDAGTRAGWPGWQASLDLSALVRETLADAALRALEADVELSLDAPDHACLIPGQPVWLSMALANVLGNAIKFTPQGGQVRVAVTASHDAVTVTVHDTGPGVPEALLAQLGRRFVKGEHARAGSGLGLSIVSRVIELHGGQLRFAQDQGLVVRMTLPK